MRIEDLPSDAAIWATILLVAVGGAAVVGLAVVWVLTLPAAGERLSRANAVAMSRRILTIAAAVFAVAFLGGLVAGATQ
jgi:hypothetical protein